MSETLEMLVAQAAGKGLDGVTIRALIEEAAEVGARRAMESQPSFMPTPQLEAMKVCQRFINQALIITDMTEHLEPSPKWQRLTHTPVVSIDAVKAVADDEPLPIGDYAVDIDSSGDGWVRITGDHQGTVRVRYRAGLASEFDGLPEPIKAGISRLTNWLSQKPERPEEPPAAVTALWRPYCRLRLSK